MSITAHDLDHWLDAVQAFLASPAESTPPDRETILHAVRLIDAGIVCRRDAELAGSSISFDRLRFIKTLARLQFATLGMIDPWSITDSEQVILFEKDLAQFIDEALQRDDEYLSRLLSQSDIATGAGLNRMDAFHSDLQWYDTLSSRLRSEPEPDRAYAIKSRLDHLAASIDETARDFSTDPELLEQAQRCREECRQLERDYLDRRIADELIYPVGEATPLSLWNRRFQLSRLEADRSAASLAPTKAKSAGTLDRLEARQQDLADKAEERLLAADADRQKLIIEDLVIAAQEESNDVLTLVEDVPLPVAVELLKSNTADFRRLTGSLRRLGHHPAGPKGVADLRRLARRSKNELQEKRLALRLENLLGKRLVGWIENLILLLILLLTGLIIVEATLAARGPLSEPTQAFFAWADLAICSVFLSEFLLKITLALIGYATSGVTSSSTSSHRSHSASSPTRRADLIRWRAMHHSFGFFDSFACPKSYATSGSLSPWFESADSSFSCCGQPTDLFAETLPSSIATSFFSSPTPSAWKNRVTDFA